MNKTFTNILFLLTAFSLSKIVGAFTSFAIPRILEPASYGAWVTILLIIAYSPIIALGTVEALLRQYPYYMGKGDFKRAQAIESNVFGSIVISSLLLILLGLSCPWVFHYPPIEPFKDQIRLMLFAAAVSLYSAFYFHRFAAHQRFQIYGVIDTIRAIVTLIFVCSLAWFWGLKGAVYGYLATELILCILLVILSIRYCGRIKMIFDIGDIWQAVKIGFPITLVWWALTLQTSVDRLVSSTLLGQIQTGYYGLGLSVVGTLLLIPQAVNRVLYPKINEGIGRSIDSHSMSILVVTPVRILSVVIPLLTGMLVITLPLIYAYIFPKYMPGLLSAQILMLGFFFVGLIGNGVNYLVAKNRQGKLLMVVMLCIAINAAVAIILIKSGLGIEGAAIGTCVAAFALATSIWSMVLSNLGYSITARWKAISTLYSPLLLAVGIMFVMVSTSPVSLRCTNMMTIAYLLMFMACYAIITFFVPPYNRASREMFGFFKERISGGS